MDVTAATFERNVLEREVDARRGEVELVKVDVDANPDLAAMFQIRGIPSVKAFHAGRIVGEFVGAQPPRTVGSFLDRLIDSASRDAEPASATVS